MKCVETYFGKNVHDRAEQLKRAVIATFHEPVPDIAANLSEFTARDWQRILFWLDSSGLALYLLDRLTDLNWLECLPEQVSARLQRNLMDNRERTSALLQETTAIGHAFQKNGINFAILKGCTLVPECVPRAELRFQGDIDFLVAENDATAALHVLNGFGYALHTDGGQTLELKAGAPGVSKIGNLYKVHLQRAVELHLTPCVPSTDEVSRQNRLARAVFRSIEGYKLPTLSPADLVIDLAQHLLKHLCFEHTRASWLLEFRRCVVTHRDDDEFWRELKRIATNEPQSEIALGIVLLLASRVFGEFAPKDLTGWTVDRLPAGIRLWVEMFGSRALLADFPGSKLYLLLQRQLYESSGSERVSSRRIIFPLHWPRKITLSYTKEPLFSRMIRFRAQIYFSLFRLRFHVVEGLRYTMEARRWKRHLAGVTH